MLELRPVKISNPPVETMVSTTGKWGFEHKGFGANLPEATANKMRDNIIQMIIETANLKGLKRSSVWE
jgi:hypothetical protein